MLRFVIVLAATTVLLTVDAQSAAAADATGWPSLGTPFTRGHGAT